MELSELNEWGDEFEAFHQRFARHFGRRESRAQAVKYLHGLMAPVERKNGWQLAEAVGDKTPDATQRLLYSSQWDADALRDELQRFVCEEFGDAEGIGVVDETGFLQKAANRRGCSGSTVARRARLKTVNWASS
jgi:SRSO17 transposase